MVIFWATSCQSHALLVMSHTNKSGDNVCLLEGRRELLFIGFTILSYWESENTESTYYTIALPQ